MCLGTSANWEILLRRSSKADKFSCVGKTIWEYLWVEKKESSDYYIPIMVTTAKVDQKNSNGFGVTAESVTDLLRKLLFCFKVATPSRDFCYCFNIWFLLERHRILSTRICISWGLHEACPWSVPSNGNLKTQNILLSRNLPTFKCDTGFFEIQEIR